MCRRQGPASHVSTRNTFPLNNAQNAKHYNQA